MIFSCGRLALTLEISELKTLAKRIIKAFHKKSKMPHLCKGHLQKHIAALLEKQKWAQYHENNMLVSRYYVIVLSFLGVDNISSLSAIEMLQLEP